MWTDTGNITATPSSVSYTHLDVYKRQPDINRTELPGGSVRSWRPNALATIIAPICTVSYTHLDVYKRQVPCVAGDAYFGKRSGILFYRICFTDDEGATGTPF